MAVKDNIVEGASLTEVAGVIEAATQIMFVSETDSPLFESALAQEGVPKAGDKLNNANPNVRVIRRIPIVVGINAKKVPTEFLLKVSIDYELQRADEPVPYPLRGGASLQQIQTSKQRDGTALTVTSATEGAEPQVATATVLQPQLNISFERVIATPLPSVHADKYIGKVNDATLLSKPKRTWLCTAVPFEIVDESKSPPRYRFTYELENNPEGWDESVGFKKDDGTFEEGTSLEVVWHEEVSFSPIMQS